MTRIARLPMAKAICDSRGVKSAFGCCAAKMVGYARLDVANMDTHSVAALNTNTAFA